VVAAVNTTAYPVLRVVPGLAALHLEVDANWSWLCSAFCLNFFGGLLRQFTAAIRVPALCSMSERHVLLKQQCPSGQLG